MTKVCIVQRRLTHYRVPLFAELRERLATRDIQLELLVGRGTPEEEKKQDAGELPWARDIPTRYMLGGRICWQPLRKYLAGIDLLILTQENKLIQNHLLMLTRQRFRLAFWGHGANLQSGNPNGLKERFKRWTTNRVDWWFAYTRMSAELVKAAGFPEERISILNNAVDTSELMQQHLSIDPDEVLSLRASLGFGEGPVGIFVGSLYADKRLEFLFEAASAIRQRQADFQLLIVGEGPEREKVRSWCDGKTWVRWVGARYGRDKAAHIAVAQVMLNPGLVGLGILDAFVCGVPLVTTDCGIHSPEIAYLEDGVNGVMAGDTLSDYVEACLQVLRNEALSEALRAGCAASAREYTVENMACRFCSGIEAALSRRGGEHELKQAVRQLL